MGRNRYFLVCPGLRTVVGGGVEGAPFPGAQPGDPLFGMAVGEVVTGRRASRRTTTRC